MKEYIKPNLVLPVSLHDCCISNIIIDKNDIIFEIEEGIIHILDSGEVEKTGQAKVIFPEVDVDFCKIYITDVSGNQKQWEIREFIEKMNTNPITITILDETYGYNQSHFSCIMMEDEDGYNFNISFYHFGEVKYIWE